MKKNTLLFAVAGAVLIIAFFYIVNRITSWGHPWFIYPAFGVLWWPLSVWAYKNKEKHFLAIFGSLLIAAFFVLVNAVTSPSFPWAMFPLFAVAWWPMAKILFSKNRSMAFAVIGTLWTIAFFVMLNLVASPHVLWFFYPVFAVLWWPFSLHFARTKQWKLYSVIGAAYITLFFALMNWLYSPHTLWFIYPAYAAAWWPLSMFFANKKTIKLFSVLMSTITVILLAVLNLIYTPHVWWVLWVVFYFAWWPLCQCLGEKAKTLTFAVIGAAAIIGYHVLMYFALTPGVHPWYLYMVLPAVWWPVTIAIKEKVKSLWFLGISVLAFALYYGTLNALLCPHAFWSIYLLFPLAWAVISEYFGPRGKFFALSVWGTAITILFFAAVNYLTSPHHIWAVYPAFVILFWPLSMYFFRVRSKKDA